MMVQATASECKSHIPDKPGLHTAWIDARKESCRTMQGGIRTGGPHGAGQVRKGLRALASGSTILGSARRQHRLARAGVNREMRRYDHAPVWIEMSKQRHIRTCIVRQTQTTPRYDPRGRSREKRCFPGQ